MENKSLINQLIKKVGVILVFVTVVGFTVVFTPGRAQDDVPVWRDEFDSVSLDPVWYWVNENPDAWNLAEQPEFLRIYASPNPTGGENLLLRPVAASDFMIKTRVLFEPDTNFQFAGLVIWQDEYNFLQLGRAFCDLEEVCVGNGIYFDKIISGSGLDGNFATPVGELSEAYLRLERRGEMVRAFYSGDEGISWTEIGTHWIPADFQVNGVGLTAAQDNNTPDWDIPADFDFFELSEGGGFLPEGYHDYDQGDVPSWACNAGGWAADPDDRAARVNVEIVVDHLTVANLVAEEFRQDLLDAGVCEGGNCGFSTSLWEVISSYEPHTVAAWAQDTSSEWVLLSSSPKDLNCRTYDIYAFNPRTGETDTVTNLSDMHEFNPRWSPNGMEIVHDAWSNDFSSHGVYLTNVQSGVSTPLAGAEGGSYPTWSPNGQWIAFDRGADEDYRLFIVAPGGGIPRLVSEDAFMASWVPNSKRLAFHRPSDGSIRTVNLNGSDETVVVERGNGPAWSPNGQWIAYEEGGDIWKVRVSIKGVPLGEPIKLTSQAAWEGRPSWSNNSHTIAYHAGLGQDTDIWTIPSSGGTATWLTGAPVFGDYDPNYSNDGRQVAYASFSPWGQAARKWASAYTYDYGSWSEGDHGYHFEATWSGGGETTDEVYFNVSSGALLHGGYVLLRPDTARAGTDCQAIDAVHPDQKTRFLSGYGTDGEMTYPEAQAFFESLKARAVWDEGMSAELAPHEIIPFNLDEWFQYVCTFSEAPPRMDLRVNYGHDWVESFYEAGHTVWITVTGDDGVTVKATAEVFTEPKDYWGGESGFQSMDSIWFDADGNGMENPPDLKPYDWVYAQVDNGASAQVQIGDISGEIDLDGDSIEGSIAAGWFFDEVEVECHPWGAPEPQPEMKYDSILPDGGDLYSCSWAGEWDIQPRQDVGVGYFGPDGHWVANAFFVPYTRFTVFPEWEWFDGMDWPDGATVTITVEGKSICDTVGVSSGNFFNGGFPDGCDIAVGDVVTFTDGETIRTHTIQNLTITAVDKAANTVAGTADTGALVYAWVHEYGYDLQLQVEDGTWLADFGSAGLDLVENMGGRAEIRDASGNGTAVDWYIPNPHFTVFPEWEWFDGMDWPDGATLTITVENKPECEVAVESWGGFFNGSFGEGCDLAIGDAVTFADGTTTRTHTVRNLAVTTVDAEANTVAGTADDGAVVYAWVHEFGYDMQITVEGGTWLADFGSLGFDLLEGMCGRSEIRDGDGNATAVDWCVP